MRITLINPKVGYDPIEPLGILYLGTVIQDEGHDVQLLDVFPDDFVYLEKISRFQPQLIGFTIMTPAYRKVTELLKVLRKRFPDVAYCSGGVHTTNLPDHTLTDLGLDFVVVGEGEETIKEICGRYKLNNSINLEGIRGVVYKKNNQVIDNGMRPLIEDISALPIPRRNLMKNYSWYLSPPGNIRGRVYKRVARMIATRGCPYHCVFCSSNQIFGRKVRKRSTENLLEEVQYLKDEYKIKGLYLVDDNFMIDKKYVHKFCDALNDNKISIKWACQAKVNSIDEDVLRKMKSNGCLQIDLGIESGSDKVLKQIKKGHTVNTIKKAFKVIHKVGMRAEVSVIVGNPGETADDIKKTIALLDEIRPGIVMPNIMTPHPGSEMFELAKQNKWFVDPQLKFAENWLTMKRSDDPVLQINFTPAEQVAIRAEIENKYFVSGYKNYVFGFMKYPVFCVRLLLSIFRNRKSLYKHYKKSINLGRNRHIAEEIFQKFNKDLVKKWQSL